MGFIVGMRLASAIHCERIHGVTGSHLPEFVVYRGKEETHLSGPTVSKFGRL